MGSTARGAGHSGAQHPMAVNGTVLAFVRGGTASDAPGDGGGVRAAGRPPEGEAGRGVAGPGDRGPGAGGGSRPLHRAAGASGCEVHAYRELFRTKVKHRPGTGRRGTGRPGGPLVAPDPARPHPGRLPARRPGRHRRRTRGAGQPSAGGGGPGARCLGLHLLYVLVQNRRDRAAAKAFLPPVPPAGRHGVVGDCQLGPAGGPVVEDREDIQGGWCRA